MSYAIDEVDQIKYQMHQLKSLFERVEVVETKMLDTSFEVKDLKASIPPSADHMQKDIKDIQVSYAKYKADMILTISDLQDQITKSNDLKNLNKLEDKLIIRQNDCVKALTKKLADRDEVTKKLRIANNSIKNIYELVKFIFIEGDEDLKEMKK